MQHLTVIAVLASLAGCATTDDERIEARGFYEIRLANAPSGSCSLTRIDQWEITGTADVLEIKFRIASFDTSRCVYSGNYDASTGGFVGSSPCQEDDNIVSTLTLEFTGIGLDGTWFRRGGLIDEACTVVGIRK